ncbi:hypothetical protein [Gorillibacterium timonense]|uniref:hypothetical protein n=1 Tax=Gorillibacterium timonense TaxID=1689269 RepID=UPI00131CADDC|nr:hypothetical protein [Gorillibacterium timonense]
MLPYHYTNLKDHAEWLEELNRLESRMTDSLGEEVRLVAYSPSAERPSAEAAYRVGLDG